MFSTLRLLQTSMLLAALGLSLLVLGDSSAFAATSCEVTYNSGVDALTKKQFVTAEQKFEQAQTLCKNSKTVSKSWIFFNQAFAASKNEKFILAQKLYKQALPFATTQPKLQGDIYNNLGSIQYNTGQPNEALPSFELALQAYQKANLQNSAGAKQTAKNVALIRENIAKTTRYREQLVTQEEAQKAWQRRHNLVERIQAIDPLLKAQDNLKARALLEEALPEAEEIDKSLSIYILTVLGSLYLQTREYDRSIAALQQAYSEAKTEEGTTIATRQSILRNLIHATEYSGHYQEAQQWTQELKTITADNKLPKTPTAEESPYAATDYVPLLGYPIMRWSDQTPTVIVFIQEHPELPDWRPEDNNIVIGALVEWQKALENKVVFEVTRDPKIYDVRIDWQDKPIVSEGANDIGGITKTRIWNGKYFASNDILLTLHDNYSVPWNPYALHGLALHEIGHMLGMRGHSDNNQDIMYPSIRFHECLQNPHLTQRDINTVQKLYQLQPTVTNPNNTRLSQFNNFKLKRNAVRWLLPTLGSILF